MKFRNWDSVYIEGRFSKTMNENEEVDPVLHIVEEIREVVNKPQICFT